MEIYEAVQNRIELKTYSDEPVDSETKRTILDAGRLASSGRNRQPWEFIVLDDQADLDALAEVSPSGKWIANVDFAVAVCTDTSHDDLRDYDHIVDAGRSVTQMQLVAWEQGVGSRIYTIDQPDAERLLELPEKYDLTIVAGFGYPDREIKGIKDRKELGEVASSGTFDSDLDLD
jgi:nitroreductase